MSQHLKISASDIISSIKLSCQIPDVIKAIASKAIITQVAREAGIEVTPEEIQQEGDKLRLEKKLVKAKDTWSWLEKHHLSVNEFEELVHHKALSLKLARHLFAPHVEKYFYENRLNYELAATYEVVFENRDLALELFYAVSEGEVTFAEIARQFIQEPELRRAGGYKGLQSRKSFRPEIAAAVFAATPPEILKPISTPSCVYLIWVEEIVPPVLDEELQSKIITEMFSDWLNQEIEVMEISTQVDFGNNLQLRSGDFKQA